MAVAVQSSATTAWASADSVVITKPTGVAVGDLLIAQIAVDGGSARSITAPSGWTAITQVNQDVEIGVAVFWKIATSTEVSASNFTFTVNSASFLAGGMVRITGHNPNVPIWTSAGDDAANVQNPTFTNTITPAVANSMLFMFIGGRNTGGSALASYAIVTSNPTWTEQWDVNAGGTGYSMGMAYALRSQTTATGDSSVSAASASGASDWACLMLAVPESKDVTLSDTMTLTDTMKSDLTCNISDTMTLTDTVLAALGKQWRNLTKNVEDWINQDKTP